MSRLSAFLSYKFDKGMCESYGREVREFLELLDVDVHTGHAFQPGSVREKVIQRLGEAKDMLVVVIAGDGLTDFCRDEMAEANSRRLAIIPLIEDGCGFKPGLFGDIEYIHFGKSHVGDSFVRLLQGVRSLQRHTRVQTPVKDDAYWSTFVTQALSGASMEERALLYGAMKKDDRNFAGHYFDPLMQRLEHKGLLEAAARQFDMRRAPYCIPLPVWSTLKREERVHFPDPLLQDREFLERIEGRFGLAVRKQIENSPQG